MRGIGVQTNVESYAARAILLSNKKKRPTTADRREATESEDECRSEDLSGRFSKPI